MTSSASTGNALAADAAAATIDGLCAEDVNELFPFRFELDAQLEFVRVGPSMRKLLPAATPGVCFDALLELIRPIADYSLDGLLGVRHKLVLLQVRGSGLSLRGQFLARTGDARIMFVGSPWFSDSAEIMGAGLHAADFALHDPAFDMLLMVDNQRMANEDLQELNRRLADKQARLAETNRQLQASEAAARKLALVAAHTANAVIIADAQARIEWVNAGFTRITGYSLDEVRGRTPGSVLQCEESDPAVVAHMRERLRREEGFEAEIINRHRSGRRYWVALEVRPIRNEAGELEKFIAIESDITERKLAEQRHEMQYAVARRLAEFRDVADTMEAVVSDICETFGWQFGALWEVDASGEALACQAWWTRGDEGVEPFVEATRGARFTLGVGLPGRVWASAQPAYVADVQADDNFPRRQAAQAARLHGGFAVPVRSAGNFIGVLEFFCRHPQVPDDALRRSLETVSSQIGQFIIRRREAARAHRLTAELNAIFDLNPDAFVAFDADDRLGYANPAFERLTGLARVRGQTLAQFDANFAAQCERPALYAPAQGQSVEEIQEVVLARPRPTTIQRAVRFIGGEQRLGRVLYLRDVTHEREVERMKSEFLSTAAHELRTPMASIYGFTELLLSRNYDDETRRDVLATINRQAGLLTRMVNELLDLARIEARAGRDFDIRPLELGPVLDMVVNSVPVGEEAARLQLEPAPAAPNVLADGDKLVQALTNLVSNAFKYSPAGGPVTVRFVREHGADGELIGVEIADRGIGMTPEQLAHATDRFYRADTSGKIPGTGLGLSLVQEIAQIMGGRLSLDSVFGDGTRATLWLRAA